MSADLVVPGELLEETGRSLGRVSAEFEHAGSNADECAAAIGHSGLSGAVIDFAGNWDHSRSEIMSAIGKLDRIALSCADTFEKVDVRFVQALEQAHQQAEQQAREATT